MLEAARHPPILVIDLEATCADDGTISPEAMETIEIGACWVATDCTVLATFQSFVRPVANPVLTAFCTNLTGITQANVNDALLYPQVAMQLSQFVSQYQEEDSSWVSWGAYDLRQFERDSARHNIPLPIALPHENAKRLFAKNQRIGKEVGMAKACQLAGLKLEGSHHRALDDALNVARLLPWVTRKRTLSC